MQSLPVMMVLLNLEQDLASLFATWFFFDPSPMLIVNQSFLSLVPIVEDQMDDIRNNEISCLKPN